MESFGSRSRRERQRSGITLEDICKSTKIGMHYLLAIEQERLDQLPGGIICRGFVRAYARCIGVDDEPAIEAFLAGHELSKAQLVPVITPEPFMQRCRDRAMRLPLWVLAAAFVAIGFGFVTLGQELRQRYDSFRESSMSQVQSNGSSLTALHNKQATPTQSTQISSNKKSASGQQAARQQQSTLPSVTGPVVSLKSDKFTVLINVREDAWMSIIVDGRRVLSETLVAPTERFVQAHDQIVVRAGNIGAVDFSFNGKRLPAQGDYDQARTLAFGANGLYTQPADVLSPSVPAPIQHIPAAVEQ